MICAVAEAAATAIDGDATVMTVALAVEGFSVAALAISTPHMSALDAMSSISIFYTYTYICYHIFSHYLPGDRYSESGLVVHRRISSHQNLRGLSQYRLPYIARCYLICCHEMNAASSSALPGVHASSQIRLPRNAGILGGDKQYSWHTRKAGACAFYIHEHDLHSP